MRALRMMVIAMLASCGGGDAKPDAAVLYEDAPMCIPGSQPASKVFLNFAGATYDHGADDALTNKADPVDMMRTLPPWPYANTAEIKACVEAALKPFKITVTDVDPGSTTPHHEILLTENWENNTVRTISASNCGAAILNTVTFVFSHSENTEIICNDVLLQFAVATTGLDHVLDCHDYLAGGSVPLCGPRSWTTTPAACGDDGPRPCGCGGSHQISMNKMKDKFGLSCAP